MTHETNTPPAPDENPVPGLLHPLTQSAAALHRALHPMSEHASLEELSDQLGAALAFEGITNFADSALILTMQSRLLDAVFNRCILQGLQPEKEMSIEKLRLGLLAQNQCAATIDRVKKHSARKKILKYDERTDGS